MKLQRLFIAISCLLALAACAAALSLAYSASHLRKITTRMSTAVEQLTTAQELGLALAAHNRSSLLWARGERDIVEAGLNEARQTLEELVKKLQTMPPQAKGQDIVKHIANDTKTYLEARAEMVRRGIEPIEVYSDAADIVDNANTKIERLVHLNLQGAQRSRTEMAELSTLFWSASIGIGVFVLILILAILIGMRRYLYLPLQAMRRSIASFRDGNQDIRIKAAGPVELREIAEVFNETATDLVHQRQTRLEFLGAVAHDLKNPLSAMSMGIELALEDSISISKESRELLEVTARQIKNMDRMVNDLLNAAKIEAGHLEIQKERLDARTLVSDAVKLFNTSTTRHSLNLRLPNSPIYCDLDPVRFSQVLNNLLVNALKYSPAGGAIDVAVDQDQDQENCAKISVADQGVGISKEDIKYIFEPFRRTPASRSSTPGVGLGLSVARRIAEAHGGTIHVESQLGVGTTFAFKLPTTRRNEVDTAL